MDWLRHWYLGEPNFGGIESRHQRSRIQGSLQEVAGVHRPKVLDTSREGRRGGDLGRRGGGEAGRTPEVDCHLRTRTSSALLACPGGTTANDWTDPQTD